MAISRNRSSNAGWKKCINVKNAPFDIWCKLYEEEHYICDSIYIIYCHIVDSFLTWTNLLYLLFFKSIFFNNITMWSWSYLENNAFKRIFWICLKFLKWLKTSKRVSLNQIWTIKHVSASKNINTLKVKMKISGKNFSKIKSMNERHMCSQWQSLNTAYELIKKGWILCSLFFK